VFGVKPTRVGCPVNKGDGDRQNDGPRRNLLRLTRQTSMTSGAMRRFQADFLLLLAAAIWGVAFYFQKTAMESVGPFLFVASRATLATLCLLPLAIIESRRTGSAPPMGLTRVAFYSGLAFFGAAALQQIGLVTATITNAGFLTALYVIATPFIAWVVLRRAPTPHVWPAVVLAFVGTWLLGGGTLAGFTFGDALIALCALVWAGHLLLTSAASPFARPIAFTAMQFAVVAACAWICAVVLEPIRLADMMAAAPSIAFVGILSSAVTFTLLVIALKHTPPSEASILVSTETLFAAAAGAVLLGERLPLIGWVGAGLMFLATLWVQVGPVIESRRRARQATARARDA
jgi:drug/metabolite transporter (DMT)-like permease